MLKFIFSACLAAALFENILTTGASVSKSSDEPTTFHQENSADLNSYTPVESRVSHGDIVKNRADYPSIVWFPDIECGGTIVNSKYIVTAAHCLVDTDTVGDKTTTIILDIDSKPYHVRTGMLNRGEPDKLPKEPTVQERIIKRVEIHPNYNPNTQENDIGIVQLCRKFDLNSSNVQAVNGFGRALSDVDEIGTVVGWGVSDRLNPVEKNKVHRPSSQLLRKADQRMIGPSDCQEIFKSYESNVNSKETNQCDILCGLEVKSKQGQCKGDSGGPLYCTRENTRPQLLCGLVSFGPACGNDGVPGVYTSFYENSIYNWMIRAIKRTTCSNLPRPKESMEPHEKCKLRVSEPC